MTEAAESLITLWQAALLDGRHLPLRRRWPGLATALDNLLDEPRQPECGVCRWAGRIIAINDDCPVHGEDAYWDAAERSRTRDTEEDQ